MYNVIVSIHFFSLKLCIKVQVLATIMLINSRIYIQALPTVFLKSVDSKKGVIHNFFRIEH